MQLNMKNIIKNIINLFSKKRTKLGDNFVKCKKNLFRSTHNKNIFIKNKYYELIKEDDMFYYIRFDNKYEEHYIEFFKRNNNVKVHFYIISDYFYSVQELRKMKINKVLK